MVDRTFPFDEHGDLHLHPARLPRSGQARHFPVAGEAFSLKDSTCASIADSAPIILLPDLSLEEAAALHLNLSGFTRIGAVVEFTSDASDELPKIDWPRRPQVFKRDIADYVADLQLEVPTGHGRQSLIRLLIQIFPGAFDQSGAEPVILAPASPATTSLHPTPIVSPASGTRSQSNEFRGIQLPEITPFSSVSALQPSTPPRHQTTTTLRSSSANENKDETLSRLNELFPDEESSGFVPNNQDITSILNKLLPDEEGGTATTPASAGSSRRTAIGSSSSTGSGSHPAQGWAVFLAKIADEGRRQKAVPLIAELAKITPEEADALSKKVIIPVLKGADQAAAEAAKQKFAKIGILARVKGPE